MTLRKLGTVEPAEMADIIAHLNRHKDQRLRPDVSNYAKGRQRYWLQYEWDLKNRNLTTGIYDPKLWEFCKKWMPDADLGLAIYGPIGISPHRDDSYADWRGVAINLGEIGSWSYDCQYPEYQWSPNDKCNPPNTKNYKVPPGTVFEFNTKNPHGVNEPAENRWAINLWKVSNKFRADLDLVKKLNDPE